jgi:hypothetical protein
VRWTLKGLTSHAPRIILDRESRINDSEESHHENALGNGTVFPPFEHAQVVRPGSLDGIWQGYDGKWGHVSQQLIALAEATPSDKFAWRPAPGVRSTSEVYMHIVMANFYLLSATGPKMPPDLKENAERTITSKSEVINWLKRSLDAVRQAHLAENPKDLARKVRIEDRDAP